MSFRRQRLLGTTFSVRTPEELGAVCAALLPTAIPAVAAGEVTARLDTVFTPDQAIKAAERLRASGRSGRSCCPSRTPPSRRVRHGHQSRTSSAPYQDLYDRALAAGFTVGQEGQLGGPTGRFAYLETEHHPGTVVEISDLGGTKAQLFEYVKLAAKHWDGSHPVQTIEPTMLNQS